MAGYSVTRLQRDCNRSTRLASIGDDDDDDDDDCYDDDDDEDQTLR